jgi:Fe-S cluster biogenesis protein NfuA
LSSVLPSELRPSKGVLQRRLGPALYRAWGRVGLLAIGPKAAAVTVILIGVACSGCSMSRGSFAKMSDRDLPTGSLSGAGGPQPTDGDLAFARNAASDVLTKGDKDSSQPWENPQTGARGSVTPLATAYADDDGHSCREFLASYVNGKTEAWLQGAACQNGRGRWEIHSLKPWRRG